MKLETLPLAPVQPSARKRRWRAPVIGLLVLGLAGGGWVFVNNKSKAAEKPAAAAAADKDKAEVFELATSDVATIDERTLAVNLPLSGSLTPLVQATVKSKIAGVVMETTVQEGQSVVPGQVLARLDAADYRARLAQQQGALDEATARLGLAQKNRANNQALLKQNYISQNAYDTTQNSVDLAQANVNSAQALVDLARIALNDTQIRAPLAGVVSKRFVQAGEKAAPDMSLYSIVNLSQLTLEAQVPTSEIPRVKVGQSVQFKVDGFAERSFSGKVARINPTTETGSRAMLVYIAVDNTDGSLRGGMFAKGYITTEQSAVVPLVPLVALHKNGAGNAVYAVVNNKVVLQPVELGLRNEDEGYAVVTAGLAKGGTVVTAQLEGVKPGSKVKIVAPSAAPAASTPAAPAKKG